MAKADYPNNFYTTTPPQRGGHVPQGFYRTDKVDESLVEDCPQCFYQPDKGRPPKKKKTDTPEH